jgi:ketosteroid isomerase-like protein
MWRETLAIGMVGVVVACQPAAMTRQERAVQEQAVQARLNDWAKAFSNRDAKSLAAFYDSSAATTMVWPDGERANGWDAEVAKEQQFFQMARQVNFVLQNPAVEVLSPTVAITTFRHAMDEIIGDVNPERRYFTGQGTLVWTRPNDQGTWVIHAGQMSETPPPPPPQPQRKR